MIANLRKYASKTMKLDSAVLKALALDPTNATASPIGGGDSAAQAYKITAKTEDGCESLQAFI